MKKLCCVLLCSIGLGSTHVKAQLVDLYTVIAFIDLISDMNEGGIEYRFTEIDGQIGTTLGLKGAWNVNDNCNVGFASHGTKASTTDIQGHVKKLRMVTSTTYIEFRGLKNRPVELHPNIGFGWGYAEVSGIYYNDDFESTSFWTAEPQMNAVMYLNKRIKLNVGCGYRWVANARSTYLNNALLSGPSVGAGLTFGFFEKQ